VQLDENRIVGFRSGIFGFYSLSFPFITVWFVFFPLNLNQGGLKTPQHILLVDKKEHKHEVVTKPHERSSFGFVDFASALRAQAKFISNFRDCFIV